MIIHDLYESPQLCPECGGISFSDLILAEKKDACYYKVKASAKVWPSAYASGRLVQCRKKGADNYGNKSESVAEAGLDEAHHGSLLNPKKGQFASVIFQSQWDTDPQIDYYNNLDDAKFDTENASAHHGSVYAWNGARWVRKMSATERTGGGGGYGSWEENKQGVAEGELDEGWKSALGAAALAGTMAMGAGGAQARVTPDGQGGFTGGLKPSATVTAPADNKPAAEAPKGFSKEYLQSVVDGKHPRPMVSVEKAKELLKNMQEGMAEDQVNEKSVSQAQFRTMAAAAHNPEFAKKVGISQDVAREFNKADKGQDYKKLPARTTEESERGRGRPTTGEWDPTSGKVGRTEKTPTGIRHHADPSRYGGTEPDPQFDTLNKNTINAMDRALGVKWDRESKKYFSPLKVDMDEGEQQKGADYRDPPEADYGDDYQDMVARVKKLAGLGPLKTVYDPNKRVYRNIPTAVQPKK